MTWALIDKMWMYVRSVWNLPAVLFFLFLFIGCKTSVNLILKTNDKVNHAAMVTLKDKKKVNSGEMSSKPISANGSDTILFKLSNGEFFQVRSTLPSGKAIIFNSPDILLNSKNNPFTYELNLKTNINLLDNAQSVLKLTGSLENIKVDIGNTPVDFKDAADNILGSLIVAVKDAENGSNRILYKVHPSSVRVRKMKVDDIKWKNSIEEGETYMDGSVANEVNTSQPLIAKFGATFENSKVYKLKWALKGFGIYLKPEDISPTRMIMMLRFEDINQIKTYLTSNKNARVYYINQANILQSAVFNLTEARIAEGFVNDTCALIANNKVYTFAGIAAKPFMYENQVLNFWGNEYSFKFDKEKVYRARKMNIEYKISYTIYNQNKSESFAPDLFK
jgi:hypothetical protein